MFLADENVMEPGTSDDRVLDRARRENRILVTEDKDFGELVYRQRRLTTGVVLLRLAGSPPQTKADVTSRAIARHGAQLAGRFAVITPGRVRIRSAHGS